MHFATLSAIPLPQDLTVAMNAVPVETVDSFIAQRFILASLSMKKPVPTLDLSSARSDQERWECLTELMVSNLMAPYDENTSNIAHMAFCDQTDEGHKAYEQGGFDCVKTPDGRIILCVDHEFSRQYELYDGRVYRRRFGQLHHRKQTKKSKKYIPMPNYPFRKFYPTFDAFMVNHWGCERQEGIDRYGYYFNPNGQWDWWQIGGRWPFQFLVKNDCLSAVTGELSALFKEEPQRNAPEGYRWVAGARKSDIAWDVMKEFRRNEATELFRQREAWFNAGQVPAEYTGWIRIVEDGLVSYGDYLYRKGENLETYLHNIGISEGCQYPVSVFACVDADGWADQGWGDSECQAEERFNKVSNFIEKQSDDTLLVSVDCHC